MRCIIWETAGEEALLPHAILVDVPSGNGIVSEQYFAEILKRHYAYGALSLKAAPVTPEQESLASVLPWITADGLSVEGNLREEGS